jgi:MFS family permease
VRRGLKYGRAFFAAHWPQSRRTVEYKPPAARRTNIRITTATHVHGITGEGMASFQWFTELSTRERRTLYAGFGGYAVDAFDFMIYSFLIPTLIATWGMSKSEAGMIATSSLISSAIGGWMAGVLADRYGRIRVLQWTIATFALFTCLSGFTHNFWQLLTTRTLQGIGFGGEWSVVTIMMAETIRSPQHRAKAVGTVQSSWSFGWGAAAILYWAFFALLPEEYAWRACCPRCGSSISAATSAIPTFISRRAARATAASIPPTSCRFSPQRT